MPLHDKDSVLCSSSTSPAWYSSLCRMLACHDMLTSHSGKGKASCIDPYAMLSNNMHKPTQPSLAAFKLCGSVASSSSTLLCAAAAAPHKGKRAIELSLQVTTVDVGVAPESLTLRPNFLPVYTS